MNSYPQSSLSGESASPRTFTTRVSLWLVRNSSRGWPKFSTNSGGCGLPAEQVDHILPLSRGGAMLDYANAQSLCTGCHDRKTRAENVRRQRKLR
ncbi:HNH endonuclease [Saccharopolyspora sp. 5N102]|uniref:HNH endonuclease n=1 Tax=Saccharopolyspora sp. 5N102 TaxID=3375155 RepID=UPI0037B42004